LLHTLIFAALLSLFSAASSQSGTAPAKQPAPPQNSAPSQAAPPPQQPAQAEKPAGPPASAEKPPEKPPKKPTKVYTNDDFKSGGVLFIGGDELDFSLINDCDRNCFDRVVQSGHVYVAGDPYWRRGVLAAIDQARKDTKWQTLLADLYSAHMKFCNLASEKRAELAKVADPENVTEREIALDEKYDAKFAALQNSVQALYQQESIIQRNYSGNSYALAFMNIQLSRIQNAGCPADEPRQPAPVDSDDPGEE
jgi:hypothetical protein